MHKMRAILSCSRVFRLNIPQNYCSPTSPQLATTTAVLTRLRYYTSRPGTEGHIRDSSDAFSKKEKAVEDQWIRTHDAEKIKHLREELVKQKKKLAELEEDIDQLNDKTKKND